MLQVDDVVQAPEFPDGGRIFAVDPASETVLVRFSRGIRTAAIKVIPFCQLIRVGERRWASANS